MIPDKLHSLFWDTNLNSFDPACFPDYTIARVLEYGDKEAVVWLRQTFKEDTIKRVILSERRLSPKSANFWALVYGIALRDVPALNVTHNLAKEIPP